jgi:hypothetical protein
MLIIASNNEVDVSHRSLHFGFVLPVFINQKLWSANYEDDDKDMLWLESILDACACGLHTNDYKIDIEFEYVDEISKETINLETSLEFDENVRPYVLIRYLEIS